MGEKIRALLFNYTKDNLDANEAEKLMMTSGEDVLKNTIQFENGKLNDSSFVQFVDIECSSGYNHIKDEQMSLILDVEKENLCHYHIYHRTIKRTSSFTRRYLGEGSPGEFIILTNKEMIEKPNPIFEIRFSVGEEWSSWQAIAGKFIVAQNYMFGPGGVAEVYHSMTQEGVESFKQNFQIRYCGSILPEFHTPVALPRIINDPYDSDIRKIVDPTTFQILFDSQLMREFPGEKSLEIWSKFESRYK